MVINTFLSKICVITFIFILMITYTQMVIQHKVTFILNVLATYYLLMFHLRLLFLFFINKKYPR